MRFQKILSVLILAIFFISSHPSYSIQFQEIASIEINLAELKANFNTETVEFRSSSKQNFGKFLCFKTLDIFEPYISKLQPSERNQLVIIAEDARGGKIVTSYYDFDPMITKIPPFLIYGSVYGSTGDTVIAWDVKGKKGTLDLKNIEKEVDKLVRLRVFLQMKHLDKNTIQMIFQPYTLIFPQDQKSVRWLNGIKYIKLYRIKD